MARTFFIFFLPGSKYERKGAYGTITSATCTRLTPNLVCGVTKSSRTYLNCAYEYIVTNHATNWIFTGPRPQLTHNQGGQRRHTAQHRDCALTRRSKWLLYTDRTISEGLMQMGRRLRTIEMDANVFTLVTNMPKILPAARRLVIKGLIHARTHQNGTKHAANTRYQHFTPTACRSQVRARSCNNLGSSALIQNTVLCN